MSASTTWTPLANRVKQLGGAVHLPPQDVLNVSRFSVVSDPQMATFALFKWQNPGKRGLLTGFTQGRVCWHELLAADARKRGLSTASFLDGKRANQCQFSGRVSAVLRRRADDRRHDDEAADGAGIMLALLLQCRRYRRCGEAGEGCQRTSSSAARWKCRTATGSRNALDPQGAMFASQANAALGISSAPMCISRHAQASDLLGGSGRAESSP